MQTYSWFSEARLPSLEERERINHEMADEAREREQAQRGVVTFDETLEAEIEARIKPQTASIEVGDEVETLPTERQAWKEAKSTQKNVGKIGVVGSIRTMDWASYAPDKNLAIVDMTNVSQFWPLEALRLIKKKA